MGCQGPQGCGCNPTLCCSCFAHPQKGEQLGLILLTPPLGPLPLPSAPDRLRKGLVWAVRTGGPPAAATAAAAAAAAMRLVLLPSEGATRAPAGSRGGADAVGSRPGVPADSSGVELPANRLAIGSWEPPAICSRCSSRFCCWICWIIW